jgi:hypothetical protein
LHLPSTAASHEPENNEKQDRTNRRLDDGIYNSDAEVNAQARQQPTPDQGSDNSDTYIRNKAMSCASNDMAAKPPCDQADKQNYKDAFTRHETPPQQ